MPIYEYRCPHGHVTERFQKMSDPALAACDTCGEPVEKIFHPVAIHFKGSGFYNTDYGKGKGGKPEGKGEGGSGGSDAGSGSSDGASTPKKSDTASSTPSTGGGSSSSTSSGGSSSSSSSSSSGGSKGDS